MLPQLSPATRLGEAGAAAYAARDGVAVATFLENLGPVLTPEQVGTDVVDLVGGTGRDADAYLLTAAGLNPVP